ncbi:MAG: hypothetical protein K2Q26_02130 [Bdellovibrionales bacterium]|nr:hypothetical protein [Bdellovibrionales bacterium]
MNMNKTDLEKQLDLDIENFLMENPPESEVFTQNVLSALPQEPRLAWITSTGPVLGGLFGLCFLYFVTPMSLSVVLSYIPFTLNAIKALIESAPQYLMHATVISTLSAAGLAYWLLSDEEKVF